MFLRLKPVIEFSQCVKYSRSRPWLGVAGTPDRAQVINIGTLIQDIDVDTPGIGTPFCQVNINNVLPFRVG